LVGGSVVGGLRVLVVLLGRGRRGLPARVLFGRRGVRRRAGRGRGLARPDRPGAVRLLAVAVAPVGGRAVVLRRRPVVAGAEGEVRAGLVVRRAVRPRGGRRGAGRRRHGKARRERVAGRHEPVLEPFDVQPGG